MNFTDWQIDKLVHGLNTYRVLKTVNGRSPPWKTVLDHLLLSPATSHGYPESGEQPTFKEEALRRFAEGGSTLQADKLEDVRRFLVAQHVLPEDDFKEEKDDLRHILTACSFLATRTPESLQSFKFIRGPYVAKVEDGEVTKRVTLRFSRSPEDWFVRVTERTEDWNRGPRAIKGEVRRGFGFACTPLNLLHIFLVGASKDVEITYVQLADDYKGPPKLTLARVGMGTEAIGFYDADPNPEHELDWPHGVHAFFSQSFAALARGPQWGLPHRDNWTGPRQRIPSTTGLPLIDAVLVDDGPALQAALARGAVINEQDRNGMTALHHAASKGARSCLRLLVASGQCNYLQRDKWGRYAYELAIEWGQDYAVARLLMKKQVQQAHRQSVPAYVPRSL